jgi:hypothetical protein
MATKTKTSSFTLPDKKIRIVPNKKGTAFIPDTSHPASFLMDGCKNVYVVPQLRNGQLQNPLTDEEKDFFENSSESGLSFEAGELSIYKKKDNFWNNFSVELGKSSKTLDLSNPYDYFEYKVLLLNSEFVAPDYDSRNDKRTYKYYLVDDLDEAKSKSAEYGKEAAAWRYFDEVTKDRAKVRSVLRLMGNSTSTDDSDDFLAKELGSIIKNPGGIERFLSIVEDGDIELKMFIHQALEIRALTYKKGNYYLNGKTSPIGDFDAVVKFFKEDDNSELMVTIKAKIKSVL